MSVVSYNSKDVAENDEVEVVAVRQAPKKILDEDEYLDRMAKIIRRDFFPNMEFAEDKSETVYEASGRGFASTPGTNRTQSSITSSVASHRQSTSLSLNEYLEKYTSEDNAYFDKIRRKELKKHQAKYPWLHSRQDDHNELVKNQLELPSYAQQVSDSSKSTSNQMVDWPYRTRNTLFYPTSQAHETKRPSSTINYRSNSFSDELVFKVPAPRPEKPRLIGRFKDKIGIDGKFLDGSETPMMNSYVPPPEAPATSSATIKSESNRFYIPSESPRDQIAHKMYQERIAKVARTPRSDRSQGDTTSRGGSSRRSIDFSFSTDRFRTSVGTKREK